MKDKIKEIILSVNPGMDVEDEDFNIAEDMDSMDILALMEELEDAFDIEITMEEKNEENFSSIDALAEMIERLQQQYDKYDYRALKLTQEPNFLPNKVEKEKQKFHFVKIIKSL